MFRSFCLCTLTGILAWTARGADGVIYYNRITSLTTPATVRRVGGDGTGDQAVPINLVSPIYPTVSRDGRRLLVTAYDPARPFKRSNNVFLLDLMTGAQSTVARYEDEYQLGGLWFTNDLGAVVSQATIQSYAIHVPYHKALSPDGSNVVVMDLVKSGDTTLAFNTNSVDQGIISQRYPTVDVFRVADGIPAGLSPTIFTCGQRRDGDNQGGDGVDWHPSLNYVVATIPASLPATGNAYNTIGGTVLTWLNAFVPIVPPATPTGLTGGLGTNIIYTDPVNGLSFYGAAPNDYAPAVSPDGSRVAYVRHILRSDTFFGHYQAQCSLRIINSGGTGDHQVMLNPPLPEGLWVTKVAWSPDGTHLAFDVAPQLILNNSYMLSGVVTESQIFVASTFGTNVHWVAGVAGAPAAYPSWGLAAAALVRPTLQMTRNGNAFQIRVNGLTTGQAFRVEGSTDLRNWENLLDTQATSPSHLIDITPDPQSPFAFYRVRIL